jgi:hypothetical protein
VVGIDEVDPDGRVANAGLPWSRLTDINLLPLEDLGTAGLVQADGSGHGINSFLPLSRGRARQRCPSIPVSRPLRIYRVRLGLAVGFNPHFRSFREDETGERNE